MLQNLVDRCCGVFVLFCRRGVLFLAVACLLDSHQKSMDETREAGADWTRGESRSAIKTQAISVQMIKILFVAVTK